MRTSKHRNKYRMNWFYLEIKTSIQIKGKHKGNQEKIREMMCHKKDKRLKVIQSQKWEL